MNQCVECGEPVAPPRKRHRECVKQYNAARSKARYHATLNSTVAEALHGTRSGFYRGCRCRRCRDAWNAYTMQRRAARRVPGTKQRGVTRHGFASTYKLGCHCQPCAEAGRRENQRNYAKRAARNRPPVVSLDYSRWSADRYGSLGDPWHDPVADAAFSDRVVEPTDTVQFLRLVRTLPVIPGDVIRRASGGELRLVVENERPILLQRLPERPWDIVPWSDYA